MSAVYRDGFPVVFVLPPTSPGETRWYGCSRHGYGESERLPARDAKGRRFCAICGSILVETEKPHIVRPHVSHN